MKSKVVEPYKAEHKEVFNKRFGVIFNGEDNLKPLIIENLIDASPTASQCAWIYESFIGGGGFEIDFSKVNLSDNFWETVTPNDLLFDMAESVSRHQGAFVVVGYNANFQKDSYQILPYSLCRVGKKDSAGYSGKIVVSSNGWGKYLKEKDVDVFDTYNPRPEVIQAQVEAAGGWENYKGQIAFLRLSKKHTYPKTLIERAYTFADVEYNLGLYYNATVKRSFENITIVRHRKFPNAIDQTDFEKNLKSLSGLENSSSKLMVEDDWDDEREKTGNFKFDTIKNDVKPDKYAHFENSSSNYIRKAFKNIPPQLVDYIAGKLGNTSGEDLLKAQSVYHSLVGRDQEKIEMFFAELFDNYKENINPAGNWKIKQYSLLDDGTANDGAQQPVNNALASFDSVTAILAIQKSVNENVTSFGSGVAMLESIFKLSKETAKSILGKPTS